MKLKFLIFATLLAAMGPARDAPPPEAGTPGDTRTQGSSARLPPVASTAPEPVEPAEAMQAPAFELPRVDALESQPADFLWQSRPVVVFADTPDDPSFLGQLAALTGDATRLAGRDVVVVTDSDPAANSVWRRQLRPTGFSLVLIDKDGQVKIRRPSPWDVREISRAIDRLPLRRQEVGQGRSGP